MSTEAVNLFFQKLNEDPELQKELVELINSAEDNEGQATTELAKKLGFDFTSEELKAEFERQNQLNQAQPSGELSDQELEAVAGGGWRGWAFGVVLDGVKTATKKW